MLACKDAARRRRLGKKAEISSTDRKAVKRMLPYEF